MEYETTRRIPIRILAAKEKLKTLGQSSEG